MKNNSNSKLVITNFNIPHYSPNGIIETKSEFGFHEMIEEINKSLRHISKTHNSYMFMILINLYQNTVKKMFLIIDNFI